MNEAEPLITVIIPTFRRPKLLRRAIVSVLNQTFPAFQVCVYDNASDDNTQHVVTDLAETDSRIKYYCHERNIGALENFNYGLKKVNTPFFLFLCDDDLLLPHFFEEATQSLSSNPDVMFYAGLTILVEDNRIFDISKNGGRFGYLSPPDGLIDIVDMGGLFWNSIVFRSQVVDCVGLLDLDVGGPADTDFVFRVAAHHPVIITNEPSAIYTHHTHTQSFHARTSDYRLYLPGFKRIINKMMLDESLSLDTRIHVKSRLNAWSANVLRILAERTIKNGEFDKVSEIAEILTRFCNKETEALLLVGRAKLKKLSEPAYFLVNLIFREPAYFLVSRINQLLWSFFSAREKNKKTLKQLQKQYGEHLHYIDKYMR